MIYGSQEQIFTLFTTKLLNIVMFVWNDKSPVNPESPLHQQMVNHISQTVSSCLDNLSTEHFVFDNSAIHGKLNKKKFAKDFYDEFCHQHKNFISTKRQRELQTALNKRIELITIENIQKELS